MKLTHKNIELIEQWLEKNSLQPSLDHEFIIRTYEEVLLPLFKIQNKESIKRRNRAFTLQFDFVRRDLLKILHKQNNKSAAGIKAGYVYAICNPAQGDWIKVGSAIDVIDRLNSYQTSSPLRDYSLIDYYYVDDRKNEEYLIHALYDRNSEWCKVSEEDIKLLFKQKKKSHNIVVPDRLLYAAKREIEIRNTEEQLRLIENQNRKQKRKQLYYCTNNVVYASVSQ